LEEEAFVDGVEMTFLSHKFLIVSLFRIPDPEINLRLFIPPELSLCCDVWG
jgi:hypothetical protein